MTGSQPDARTPAAAAVPAADVPTLRVWDRPVRLLHWTLVGAVALSWLSTEWWGRAHQPAGYVALAAVLLRLAWGLLGRSGRTATDFARFQQFVRGPRATLNYAVAVIKGREPRFVGHNPLGAWMVLALIGHVAGLALSGWLYTSDWFWGNERVEQVHVFLAWSLVGMVVLHVSGVVFTSLRHRENLVLAMLNGRKRAPQGDDVP